MTPLTTYLLDANVFIEAKRRYYAFDLCPGFWDSLFVHYTNSRIKSIDRVKTIEFQRGNDDLKEWASQRIPGDFFAASEEPNIVTQYAEVIAWVQNQQRFFPFAKTEFANSIDGWLIAYAKVNNMVLVTHEERAPQSKAKVKIPDVCDAIGVLCVDTFDMLRALGTRFILPPTA
jgi:hypothetical protein